ncbi:MAG: fibronectin type III domain-containing protein [bacterium]
MSACGSGGSTPDKPQPDAGLEVLLNAELERLGIDPQRSALRAPSTEGNTVFDLSSAAQPDGSILLSWTERILGDYDGNGTVNISDLSPLAREQGKTVEYDDPALHDGIAHWPTGDPDVDADGNWKRARIDGDGNGLIGNADVTVIAQHWNERISGYMVFRRRIGSEQWVQLPNLEDDSLGFTVLRPELNAVGLYRYSFVDIPPDAGEYEYRVAAYDSGIPGPQGSANLAQQSSPASPAAVQRETDH